MTEETRTFTIQALSIMDSPDYGATFEIGETAMLVIQFARTAEIDAFLSPDSLKAQRILLYGGGNTEVPLLSCVIVDASVDLDATAELTCSVEFYTDFNTDEVNAIEVVSFTTPHIGRRGLIVMAVAERLKEIKMGHPVGKRLAWRPDTGRNYPISVKTVLLEPLQPIALDRDKLLPALIVQYGDGVRKYKSSRSQGRGGRLPYNTHNEYEEAMMVNIRAILRPSLEATQELARQGVLTGESLTITTANLHESIDAALGDGLDLHYKGQHIEGIRELVTMKWTTPFDMWASDYAILDIPIQITHVATRGEGV